MVGMNISLQGRAISFVLGDKNSVVRDVSKAFNFLGKRLRGKLRVMPINGASGVGDELFL